MKKIIIGLTLLSSISTFANTKGGSDVFPNSRNEKNSQILITGKSAKVLFEKLEIVAKDQDYFNTRYSRKTARQFSCTLERSIAQTIPATPDSYYCVLLVDPVGEVLGIDQL